MIIGEGNSSEGVEVLIVTEVSELGDEDLEKANQSSGQFCSLSFELLEQFQTMHVWEIRCLSVPCVPWGSQP